MSMDASGRRRALMEALAHGAVLTGQDLASTFGVSRQVIVQDVAILRARGEDVLATPQGYCLRRTPSPRRIVAVRHRREEIEDELTRVVDEGARVVDVIVEHPLYGELRGLVMCSSRSDVRSFMARLAKSRSEPLLVLTDGVHLHTLEASEQAALERAEASLRSAGYVLDEA